MKLQLYKNSRIISFPFHPFAIVVFFLSNGYLEYFGMIPLGEMLVYFAKAVFVGSLIILLFSWLLKSWRKAALLTSYLLGIYLFFGAIKDPLWNSYLFHFIGKYSVLLTLLTITFFALFIYLKKTTNEFRKFTVYLNALLLLLILVDFIRIAIASFEDRAALATSHSMFDRRFSTCDSCVRPDIYFIVMDEYCGNDMLREYFHYNNDCFSTFLEQKGFHVLKHPSSNYSYTPISMGSIFNMEYADWLNGRKTVNATDFAKVSSNIITRSATIRFLISKGYSIKNLSIFDIAGVPSPCNFHQFPLKMALITAKTLVTKIERLNWSAIARQEVQFAKENNQKLIDLTYENIAAGSFQPKFIYTHLFMPHYPHVYDSLGQPSNYYENQDRLSVEKNLNSYLQYLVYTNRVVEKMIDSIMNKTGGKSVVVLMSDHGYRGFDRIDPKFLKNNNFNAIYLPSRGYGQYYDSMSNVNQFRALLNSLFRQNLPLLKDSVVF